MRRRSETCENRGQCGSTDKPRAAPWAQEVIPKWTGFSRVAADDLLPRRLLVCRQVQKRPPSGGLPDFIVTRQRNTRETPASKAQAATQVHHTHVDELGAVVVGLGKTDVVAAQVQT